MQRSTTATTSTSTICISVVGVGLGDPAQRGEPGVVDQDVDGDAELDHPGRQDGACRPVGEVGGQHVGLPAARSDLVGERAQLVLAAGDEHDPVAAAGQLAGDLGADALRGAGDERGAVGAGCGKASWTQT